MILQINDIEKIAKEVSIPISITYNLILIIHHSLKSPVIIEINLYPLRNNF